MNIEDVVKIELTAYEAFLLWGYLERFAHQFGNVPKHAALTEAIGKFSNEFLSKVPLELDDEIFAQTEVDRLFGRYPDEINGQPIYRGENGEE